MLGLTGGNQMADTEGERNWQGPCELTILGVITTHHSAEPRRLEAKLRQSTEGIALVWSQSIRPLLHRSGLAVVIGVVTVAAWGVPLRSPPEGRPQATRIGLALDVYSYAQFTLALTTTGLFLSALYIAARCRRGSRKAVFRVASIWLGVGAVILPWEMAAALLPPKNNPFYTFNEGGMAPLHGAVGLGLPYVRPAHLRWEGRSQGDIPEWLPDPHARRLTFQTDFEGFRNSIDLREADLIFIGDSFTEGGNVLEQETFVQLTARKAGCTARNLGRFGYAPQAELIVLKEYGLRCAPKAVVWQLSEGNDLLDALGYERWVALGPRAGLDAEPGYRHYAWEQRSPTFAAFLCFVRRARYWYAGSFQDAQGTNHWVRFGYHPSVQQYPLGHPAAPWWPEQHPGWQPVARTLAEGARILSRQKIPLVVLYIPMKITVLADFVEMDAWSRERMPALEQDLSGPTFGTELRKVCRDLDVPFVDSTPRLRQAGAAGELVFLPYDTHLSPRGHVIVSDLITAALASELQLQLPGTASAFLPRPPPGELVSSGSHRSARRQVGYPWDWDGRCQPCSPSARPPRKHGGDRGRASRCFGQSRPLACALRRAGRLPCRQPRCPER